MQLKNKVLLFALIFSSITCLYAQTHPVRGKILGDDGLPLSNVSVQLKGTNKGTVTNEDGTFTLELNGSGTLIVNVIGFASREVQVQEGQSVQINLSKDVKVMNEVVVTALGVRRDKRILTYSTQEVKGDELLKAKEPNVVNALAGKVSGVQITSSSGTPGSSSRIVVRGATSIYGDNQALIVVDGIPINNDETGNLNSGPGTNRLADIDPATIENINVLKGAAATALYGSAGARGVVMITTKNGAAGRKPTVNFSSDLSFEHPLVPEVQNKYAQGDRGVYYDGETQKTSSSWGPLMDTLRINGQPAKKYNQLDQFFRTGVTSNNTVSVNGGGTNSGYFMSYSYFDQKGTVPQTSYKRHSVFTKYTTRILDNLTSNFQINYSSSINDRMPEGYVLESPLWTVLTAPISWNPLPYLNPDGTQRVFRYSRNNPYWVLDNIYNKARVNRFIPVATFTYTPLKWLNVTERLGADIFSEQDKYKEAVGSVANPTGKIIDQNINFRQFNHDFIVNAQKEFGSLQVDLLLGNNVLSTYSQTMYAKGVGLNVDGFDNISSASNITYNENHYLTRKVGFYAQSNIDYKKLLVLSLTGRYDGSSVLSKDKSFYPYGSVATSFIFSELLPTSLSDIINLGKLRVSYATVGNDGVGAYSLSTPYYSATVGNITFPYQGQSGFLLSSTLGNSNLKNERLNEFEVGLETRMLHNRVGLEASYYYRKTTDGIIPGVAIAPSTGYTGTTVNTASLENKGLEVLLNATPVKARKFQWDLTANFTRIRNKVLSIYENTDQLGNGFTQVIVGQPYGVIYGGKFKRAANGELMIDASGLPFSEENGIIGNINPDWLAGLSNSFHYGSFALSFFFDMKKGGDIQNNVDGYGYFYGTPKVTENRADRVVKGISVTDNKENTVSVSGQDYYRRLNGITEAVIQDGTYIKLRNVSVSYEVSKALLKRTPFKSAALILTGRNLWIYSPHFTGGDPEVSSFGSSNGSQGLYSFSTPTSRSVGVTLKVGF